MWGIIGGTGFEDFETFSTLEELDRETPFGLAASGLKRVSIDKHEAIFISRHGIHHELLPSDINFRANIFALKKLGVTHIIATSAVGSLQTHCRPGDMVIPNQYFDRTKGLRKHSFTDIGFVAHVSLADPIDQYLENVIAKNQEKFPFNCHFNKTYVCIEGPYFSTRFESKFYKQLGADIIGMTQFPEFALAREAGINYLPCCFVTDYDSWNEHIAAVTQEEVSRVMQQNNNKALTLISHILNTVRQEALPQDSKEKGIKQGLITPLEKIPTNIRSWLDILIA